MRLNAPALLAAGIGCTLLAGPAAAAPDQTQGVALMSATVKPDGTLVGGAGVVSAFKLGTGRYQTVFNRSVEGCTAALSFGSPNTAVPQGMASVIVPTVGSDSIVSVLTLDTTGAIADRGFMLIVFCAQ